MTMNKRPLLWIAVFWVIGSAAAAGLGLRGSMLVGMAAVLLAVSAAAWKWASPRLVLVCLVALALAAGHRLWADVHNETELVSLREAAMMDGPETAYAVQASGIIISPVEVDGDRAQFRMEAHAVHAEGHPPLTDIRERFMVQLRLQRQQEQDIAASWRRGDIIVVTGEVAEPAAATNNGGFNYRRYLHSQRIHWLLKGTGTAAIKVEPVTGTFSAASMLGRADAARQWLGARFDVMYPENQAGYMKGLILGLREDLDPQQFGQFSRLGLTHILAISGLHVGVFLYVLGGLLRLLRLPKEKILLLLLMAVPLYVMMTGGSPSVLRAGIMSMLGLAAARMGKLKDGLHLISAAALALLLINPYFLNDVSFQLSFIVTLGLIVGVPPLRRRLPKWKRHGWMLDLFAVTVTAQLVSFPVTIYYFNQFHLLSLLANLLLVPFISFAVIPLGTASLAISILWKDGANVVAAVTGYANEFSFYVVDWMASGSSDNLRLLWKTPPLWWVFSWLILLIFLFRGLDSFGAASGARRTNKSVEGESLQQNDLKAHDDASADVEVCLGAKESRIVGRGPTDIGERPFEALGILEMRRRYRRFFVLLLAMVLLLGYAYWPDRFSRDAVVSFLDVGQGDATLIRTPGGKHILIDGGGTISFRKPEEAWKERKDPYEVGGKVVVPLLMKRGVQRIDLLVISHLDSDHIRGLQAVVEQIPVSAVWWNGTTKEAGDVRKLLGTLIAAEIPLYAPKAGDEWHVDPHTKFRVLWPSFETEREEKVNDLVPVIKDQNEHSLVLLLETYGQRFLFTGDIGSATERALVRMMREEDKLVSNGNGLSLPNHTGGKRVTVMKVAHHGSRYSTSKEWLAFWRPDLSVASASATNPYGHPHPDVLGRLQAAESVVWRTDRDGETAFKVSEWGLLLRTK